MLIDPKQIRVPKAASANHPHETMWFSKRRVPEGAKRLSTGDPIQADIHKAVRQGIHEALKTLKPGRTYKAVYFVGHADWEDLSRGDKSRAGRCLADLVRSREFPVEMVQRPAGASTKRYRILWTPLAPPAVTPKKSVSAASIKVPGFVQAVAAPLAKTVHR